MSDSIPKAATLRDVQRFARPEPLTGETWRFYVKTDKSRGSTDVRSLIEQLRTAHSDGTPLRAIFAGHRGCGKSTELTRVSHEVGDLYAGEICRVEERYSLPTLDYRQLLFLCADVIMQYAKKCQVVLDEAQEKSLLSWFDRQTVEEVERTGHEVSGEAGVKLGFLSALFANISGKIFSGGSTQQTVSKYIEQRLNPLYDNMRILVRAVEEVIAPRRLLLILEGLDKIESLQQSRSIFIDYRLQLLMIPCSVIFTYPIRLWYEPDNSTDGYDYRKLLPMIPVADAPPSRDLTAEEARVKAENGRNTLKEIVLARLQRHLIADDALDFLVRISGGVLRDLMYMLRDAALQALYYDRSAITLQDAKLAARRLRGEYVRHLSPPSQGSDIKLEDIQKCLGGPLDWPRRAFAPTPAFKLLLQNLCLLEYNGDTWHDLHPLVRDHLEIVADEQRRRAEHKG